MKSNKDKAALLLFVVGAVVGFSPSLAKAGLFADATNAEVGLEVFMVWLTAIILYFLPNEEK